MWGYVNKLPSLEEKALAQVAINLCQENGFKEVALRLEKPTYGCFFISSYEPVFFVSDPEKLSIWARVKEDDRLCDNFMRSCYMKGDTWKKLKQWDTTVDEQCRRLMEVIPLPNRLRQNIRPWINRIALEYLSYSRRQEMLFGVSRYFLMDIVTRGDWKETGRLDEMKLAQRLLEDERLTVLQRYRIACVYCLHVHIPHLWERLTQEEKRFTSGDGERDFYSETQSSVLSWSRYMNSNEEEKVTWQKNSLWPLVSQAMSYSLMVCWKELQEDVRQKLVIDRALESLRQWQSVREFHVKSKLVLHQTPERPSAGDIEEFYLPSYYSELMHFFLSQMDQEQQLTFFKKASKYRKSVLECFLDWPHQDNFLPKINRLWGVIPKDHYVQCLLALASKYSEIDSNTNCIFDYRSLLRALWEETPEEYKQYVFCDRKNYSSVINEGEELLCQLLERSPFRQKDEALFKLIFRDQPQEKRRAMMLSEKGEKNCLLVLQKEKWSFLNGLLEECLPQEEICSFKKQFIQSDCGVKLCLDALEENHERLVEDLLNWSSESEAEKTKHKENLKGALINGDACLHACETLLRDGKFADVERVINFCLSSDEKKELFKVRFAQRACAVLLKAYATDPWSEHCLWEQMDTITAWSVDTEEKIRDFKKDLFSREGIDTHYRLLFIFHLFIETPWRKVECFYQWFGLSREEIKQLKRDTLYTPQVFDDIYEDLPEYTNTMVDSLRWCLTDEEMVIDFKKEVEEYFTELSNEEDDKKQLDNLMSELLDGVRKEDTDKASREGIFAKDKGEEKLSVGTENESSSPRKRRK